MVMLSHYKAFNFIIIDANIVLMLPLIIRADGLDVLHALGGYAYVHTSSNGTCPIFKTLMFKLVVIAVGRTV
eukprot:6582179-Ditylum_brightwellii.AAC.1